MIREMIKTISMVLSIGLMIFLWVFILAIPLLDNGWHWIFLVGSIFLLSGILWVSIVVGFVKTVKVRI